MFKSHDMHGDQLERGEDFIPTEAELREMAEYHDECDRAFLRNLAAANVAAVEPRGYCPF
jgi:hypothetical protein